MLWNKPRCHAFLLLSYMIDSGKPNIYIWPSDTHLWWLLHLRALYNTPLCAWRLLLGLLLFTWYALHCYAYMLLTLFCLFLQAGRRQALLCMIIGERHCILSFLCTLSVHLWWLGALQPFSLHSILGIFIFIVMVIVTGRTHSLFVTSCGKSTYQSICMYLFFVYNIYSLFCHSLKHMTVYLSLLPATDTSWLLFSL